MHPLPSTDLILRLYLDFDSHSSVTFWPLSILSTLRVWGWDYLIVKSGVLVFGTESNFVLLEI